MEQQDIGWISVEATTDSLGHLGGADYCWKPMGHQRGERPPQCSADGDFFYAQKGNWFQKGFESLLKYLCIIAY